MYSEEISLIRGVLDLYINGRPQYIVDAYTDKDKPEDCKGKHCDMIQQILEDAKIVCTDKDYTRKIHREYYKYATLIGRYVSIDWFNDINITNLSIKDYEKIDKFFETYEYNQDHQCLYTENGTDIVYKYDGQVWYDGKLLEIMYVDYTQTDVNIEVEHRCIAVTKEEKEQKFKSMFKEYE